MLVTQVYDAITTLPPRFNTLFEAAEQRSLFFSRSWFELVSRDILKSGHTARIYALATNSGVPQAVAPMACAAPRHKWSPRVLEGLATYYTSLFSPLVAPEYGPKILRALGKSFAADRCWDIIDLHPLARDDLFDYFVDALRESGFLVQTYFCFLNWYLQVESRSFDEYYFTLPSDLKNTINRKTKQLKSTCEVRVAITTGVPGLDAALHAYETVYGASWKPAEASPTFIRELIRCSAASGSLRLGVLYADDEPAATQLWIVAHGRAAIYKLAHDERFSKWSVGSQLMLEMMRHALDVDKVTEVDFLTGDDAYKNKWMSHSRERWGIAAFNRRRLRGLLAGAYHIGGRAIKNAALFQSSARS